jgi:hypothetical protein
MTSASWQALLGRQRNDPPFPQPSAVASLSLSGYLHGRSRKKVNVDIDAQQPRQTSATRRRPRISIRHSSKYETKSIQLDNVNAHPVA